MYLAALVSLLLALLIPVDLYFKSYLPKTEGTLKMEGLSAPVSVYRDRWGIPHIVAENDSDLFRAYGYTVASDRLFQMEMLRRIANGTLSELLGNDPELIKADTLLRKLRLRKSAEEYLKVNREKMDPQMLQLVDSFLSGVNFYVKKHGLPLELKLVGMKEFKPFELQEIMGVAGYMGLSFAEGMIADPLKTMLLEEFPPEMVNELYLREGADKNQAVSNKVVRVDQQWYRDIVSALKTIDDRFGLYNGSNSWVLSGKRSKNGLPLLANDPHIAFASPSVWYEAHLKTPSWEIYGHFVPLAPFPAIGHDKNRAWAVTMAEVDDQDFYLEQIDLTQKAVMFNNKWEQLRIEQEVIKVKDGEDVKIDVLITPHGPVMDGTDFSIKGKALALKWAYHHSENHTISAIYQMMRAQNYEDFKKALALGVTPALNVSYVDKEGNIAWHIMAKIPILPKGVRTDQVLDGSTGKHEYIRYAKFEENPYVLNPESGVIVTANYYPEWNPAKLSLQGYWQPAERYERISNLLKEQELWSIEELKAIQFDSYVMQFENFKKLLPQLNIKFRDEIDQKAFKLLTRWDGFSKKESRESSIFHMWFFELSKQILGDELGEERLATFAKVADLLHFMKYALTHPESKWWDDRRTVNEVETREQILEKAFLAAVDRLKNRLGPNINHWQWGKLHTIEFMHPFGRKKPMDKIFNLGPYAAQGGYSQVDNMSTNRFDDSFKVNLGPSTRRLIDMSDPTRSLGILPTGNSGVIQSPHYSDQVPLFLNGKYRPQFLEINDVLTNGYNLLKLLP
ncbi:MAG: penicillin acylase family protein [Bdellovibrio sp.]